MKQVYLKYRDKHMITKRRLLFFKWKLYFPYRKGDEQYKPDILFLAARASRLYLLPEFQHLTKSIS